MRSERRTPHAARRTPHAARRTPHAARRTPHAKNAATVLFVTRIVIDTESGPMTFTYSSYDKLADISASMQSTG
jgi:hypothetical protein